MTCVARATVASAAAKINAARRQLGVAGGASPTTLEELACVTRALGRQRLGDLYGAYREVHGKLSSTAMALRDSLVAMARPPGAPAH